MKFLFGSSVVLFVAFIVLSPLVTIWALNTLFNLNIDMNWLTYFAMTWLTFVLSSARAS